MPSGEKRVVNARKEMLEAMFGPGWFYSSISLPSLLLLDEVPVPSPINSVYMGVRACNVRKGCASRLFSGPKKRTVP